MRGRSEFAPLAMVVIIVVGTFFAGKAEGQSVVSASGSTLILSLGPRTTVRSGTTGRACAVPPGRVLELRPCALPFVVVGVSNGRATAVIFDGLSRETMPGADVVLDAPPKAAPFLRWGSRRGGFAAVAETDTELWRKLFREGTAADLVDYFRRVRGGEIPGLHREEAALRLAEFRRRESGVPAISSPTPRPTAKPTAVVPLAPPPAVRKMRFREIPPGTFVMGCTAGDVECFPDEIPPRRVSLTRVYSMAETETTNAQYRRCVEEEACEPPESRVAYSDPGMAEHPVVWVSWNDAVTFCRWAGGRLPTEAEWERAARGGLPASRYPWGAGISHDDSNFDGTGGRDRWTGTAPVASFHPNGFGLFDVAGNAWEWIADFYSEELRSAKPLVDPAGPGLSGAHLLRGGSWLNAARRLRVSDSVNYETGSSNGTTGFRCAR